MIDGEATFWIVSGRVQGVGYRWFAVRSAEELGVRGWVRNTADGKVEVLAVGDAEKLKAFEQRLWKGPSLSDVENVDKVYKTLDVSGFKSFKII